MTVLYRENFDGHGGRILHDATVAVGRVPVLFRGARVGEATVTAEGQAFQADLPPLPQLRAERGAIFYPWVVLGDLVHAADGPYYPTRIAGARVVAIEVLHHAPPDPRLESLA